MKEYWNTMNTTAARRYASFPEATHKSKQEKSREDMQAFKIMKASVVIDKKARILDKLRSKLIQRLFWTITADAFPKSEQLTDGYGHPLPDMPRAV